jgi:hypothetical protein
VLVQLGDEVLGHLLFRMILEYEIEGYGKNHRAEQPEYDVFYNPATPFIFHTVAGHVARHTNLT